MAAMSLTRELDDAVRRLQVDPYSPSYCIDDAARAYKAMAEVLQRIGGSAGVSCFAVGLYGAGISSALTARRSARPSPRPRKPLLSLHTPAAVNRRRSARRSLRL